MKDGMTNRVLTSAYRALHHPLTLIIALAIAVRLILAPFLTYDYDIYHWGVIIENFQSGNGLYNLDGYYYTPTWGYILGSISLFQDAFLNIGMFGDRIVELLGVEDLVFRFHTATTTTIAFNLSMKVPLIICDAIVAWLLYRLILDRTGNEKKALAGAALWLFCPTVLYMSGIQAQFDTISVLMMLITVILVYKDRCFLAGLVFGAAVLLKFFPAFTVFVLAAYILRKHHHDGTATRKLLEAVVGAALICAVLMAPQIMDGSIGDTLSFITGRVDIQSESDLIIEITGYATMAFALICMVLAGVLMHRTEDRELDNKLFTYTLLALSGSMLMSATPQYMMVLMPLLILYLVASDGRTILCWGLISAGTVIAAAFNNNFMLIDSAYAFMGIGSADWILGMAEWFESDMLGAISLMDIITFSGGIIYYIGMVLLLLLLFEDWINRYIPPMGKVLSKIRGWNIG